MKPTPDLTQILQAAVDADRLLKTAIALIETPSPTRSGKAVADKLAEILQADGFDVERPDADWPEAPAVVARFDSGKPGKTLQFNGHLDTVHLPFVPPRVEDGILYGSGAIDMKGGVAAMVEALRAVRDAGVLQGGSILLTAHDLHEAPWGDSAQLDGLIDAGYVGDGVLIPEYTAKTLPVIGRGMAILDIAITRDGEPTHEVMGGIEAPSVIAVGADVVARLQQLHAKLSADAHPSGLRNTAFIGQINAGEIFNQQPTECRIQGTRRWLPEVAMEDVRREYFDLLAAAETDTGTHIEGEFLLVRDAFELRENDWLVDAFQMVAKAVRGEPLPTGVKPFCDDGNTFSANGIPCITHGPDGSGAHTLHEQVAVAELERVAHWYALAAAVFCDA